MTSPTTNRRYGVSSGTAIKAPCRVGTTVNITLSGLQTIDGITVVADDRVLVKNQSNTTENGIYVAASGDWVRDVDCDGSLDIVNGTTVLVTSGGQAKTFWMFSGTNPITPGSSAISIVVAPQTQPTDLSTFLATATGASSSRTLAAHYGDIVNVLDYGAVGDGVTDDTASCQAAITSALGRIALNGRCAVWFPPDKTYVVSGLTVGDGVAGKYITLLGYGARLYLKTNAVVASGFPIMEVTATEGNIFGFNFNGNQGNQPAGGWSDSYNGGANNTGRAYCAAIRASQTGGCTFMNVADCTFIGVKGACIATQGVRLNIRDCEAVACAQEFVYATVTGGGVGADSVMISNNYISTLATGNATVNANGIYVNGSTETRVVNNTIKSIERSGVYYVAGVNLSQAVISNNIIDTNTKDNFAGVTVDTTSFTVANLTIANNTMYNVGAGIKCTGTNLYLGTFLSNQVYTTTGTTSADGISIAQVATANIANNSLHDIKRHGIIVSGQTLNFICTGNTCYGQATATSYGLQINATTGTWPNAVVRNNIFSNFEGSAGGLGCVNFTRSAAYTLNILTFQNNIILTGSDLNKAFSDGGVAVFTYGQITDNSMQGITNVTSTSIRMNNNFITGVQTMPANTANFEQGVAYRTTVGAAGGATALPATPLGYIDIFINGAQRSIPYYNP